MKKADAEGSGVRVRGLHVRRVLLIVALLGRSGRPHRVTRIRTRTRRGIGHCTPQATPTLAPPVLHRLAHHQSFC